MGAGMQIPTSQMLLNLLEKAKLLRVWVRGTQLRQGPGTDIVPEAQTKAGTSKV